MATVGWVVADGRHAQMVRPARRRPAQEGCATRRRPALGAARGDLPAGECEASHEISAAADWPVIAQRNYIHVRFYAEKPWLKRANA